MTMTAQPMVSPCAARFLSLAYLFIPSITADNRGQRSLRHTVSAGHPNHLGHAGHEDYAGEDTQAIVLDFSTSPFEDLSNATLNFALSDPYKTNPKNGTPWFRYTKVKGRGQANHSHFGGLTATGDFAGDIVKAHNVVRERAGVSPLEWSSQLGDIASARVHKLAQQGCYIEHSPLSERWQKAGFKYLGENLYKVINMKPSGVDIVDAWYAEIEDYTFGLVGSQCVKQKCAGRSSPPCTLGHFTQVMWAESTHVGCARAECPQQSKRTFISVCNYGPGGNIVGRYPYSMVASRKLGSGAQDCNTRQQAEGSRRRRRRKHSDKHHNHPEQQNSGVQQQVSSPIIAMALASATLAYAARL